MGKNLFLIATAAFLLNSFSVSAQSTDFSNKIRINVWAEMDACPELAEAQNTSSGQFDYTINRIKQTSVFLLNGMTNGWRFCYTPSDKLRNVKEEFAMEEIRPFKEDNNTIVYQKPWIQDNLVHSWVEFERTPRMKRNYTMWNTIKHKKIQGRGYAPVKNGFEGITNAAKDALKNAIRKHYQAIIKNKPKEIRGSVLIRNEPRLGIDAGQYMVELDFFLETDRIILYKEF